jgi:L-ascorbate metabolism protein UlaG (beta-lactamase superfamily)
MKSKTKAKIRWKWVQRVALALGGTLVAFLLVVVVDAWTPTGRPPSGQRLERVQRSPQYRGDHFLNFLPRNEPEFWAATSRWLSGAPHTVPVQPPPVERPNLQEPPRTGLRLTWLGHSTTLVEIDGEVLLLDPVWSDRCSPLSFTGPQRFHPPPLPLKELPKLSAVVISHDHYDHLDHETIMSLDETSVRFLVPLGVGSHLEYWGVDPARIVELDWWESVKVGALELTATPARHFSGRSLNDRDETLWSGWAAVGPKHRVYYSGDTAMFPEFAEIGERLGPFDATLIEVGAYNQLWADVHLGPEQALAAHQMVKGKVLFPVHWGTFDLALHAWTEPMERLLAAAPALGVRFVTPIAGHAVEPELAGPPSRWWPELPWETVAKSPIVSSGL